MKIGLAILGFITLCTILGLLFAYPTMWLLNYVFAPTVLVAVFGTATVGLWKAWAINALAGILFKTTSGK